MNLFQNLIIPGYIEGLDHDSHIPSYSNVHIRKPTPYENYWSNLPG